MLLYITLSCKNIAQEIEGHKRFMLTELGGGGCRNRMDPKFLIEIGL